MCIEQASKRMNWPLTVHCRQGYRVGMKTTMRKASCPNPPALTLTPDPRQLVHLCCTKGPTTARFVNTLSENMFAQVKYNCTWLACTFVKHKPHETLPHQTGSRHTHRGQPRRPSNRQPRTTSDYLGRVTREATQLGPAGRPSEGVQAGPAQGRVAVAQGDAEPPERPRDEGVPREAGEKET
jgi:hypothetical protein